MTNREAILMVMEAIVNGGICLEVLQKDFNTVLDVLLHDADIFNEIKEKLEK